MLQAIRELTHGWVAGTIISVIILSFALWGIHSYFESRGGPSVVATVNGVEISKDEFTVAYERLRRQTQAQYGGSKDESLLKQRALQALIDIQVLKQASIKQGFYISSDQIDSYLQGMPEFQVDGQFSLEKFQEILSSTMMTTSDFFDLVNTSLLIDQPKLGILLTSFALPSETDNSLSLVDQERDIAYLTIPAQFFLNEPIVVPSEKIKAYYDEHKNDFMTPEQVSLEYLQLSLADLEKTFTPTDAELNAYYSENINSYTQATAWKLADILIPVPEDATSEVVSAAEKKAAAASHMAKSGQSFEIVGAPYSSENMFGRGMMILNQVPSDLQNTVAGMVAANQVSDPIRTNKGFVILKVVDYRGPKVLTFDEVHEKVKAAYVRQRAEEKFAELRDRLADVTYEHPESLKLASSTLNLPVQASELFSKDEADKGISEYKKVRDVAFSNDVLNLQNNSDVIQLNSEAAVVIRVKSHVPPSLLTLQTVYKQIEDKLRAEEAEVKAEKFAEELKNKLQTGEDAEKLAANYKFKWHQAGFIGRYSKNVDTAILETAFSMPSMTNNQSKPLYGITRLPNGYAIIALRGVKNGLTTDTKQRSVFAEQVQNSEGLLEYELYKRSLAAKAKIKVI